MGFTCVKEGNTCYELSFDERQCQTDSFLISADTPEEKFEQAKNYLKQNGITINAARFDPQYLTIVCEACQVCPTGLRFFFEVAASDTSKFSKLDVLNPETKACE